MEKKEGINRFEVIDKTIDELEGKNKWSLKKLDIENNLGMVYQITDIKTGEYYIGQKKFWVNKKYPPLKGYKRNRRKWVESDWRTYNSSSNVLQDRIRRHGTRRFRFDVLWVCKNKAEMNYLELREQVTRDVLLDSKCLNGIIQVRISRNGLEDLNF